MKITFAFDLCIPLEMVWTSNIQVLLYTMGSTYICNMTRPIKYFPTQRVKLKYQSVINFSSNDLPQNIQVLLYTHTSIV